MAVFQTLNTHGYSAIFSPYSPNHLAVATSDNFGISGQGTLYILNINTNGTIQETHVHHWSHGLYDTAWSQTSLDHVLTGSADSSLQLWNLNMGKEPLKIFLGHANEVSSVDWSRQNQILSTSWDTSIKLWDPNRSICLNSFMCHSGIVYEGTFSKYIPNFFASVTEDGKMKLWDALIPNPVASFRVHDNEVLSCDWCKHDQTLIATCGSDTLIRGWDIRSYRQPVFQLKGGNGPIKRVKFSPHYPNILASVSFDYMTKVWDFKQSEPLENFKHHSGFVYGLDWNSYKIGELATCSWDSQVTVFTPNSIKNLRNKL